MENFKDLQSLRSIIDDGEKIGLDFSLIKKKYSHYIESKENGTIKIVLLGTFSDGKTTAIAGLLGKLESNMKIDEDESSDELSIYHIDALGQEYEIVDTPGLFGTKEKEIDGQNVKFSEITERYISEAHILIYVCNSVNTLKDSHKEIIKKILRDYNKLDHTIFVVNKMDDVADTNDEEEYYEVAEIKRKTLIARLKQVIGLTSDEESKLNIACIAANPKAKGLGVWFENMDEYKKRSHIGQLEKCVSIVARNSDVSILKNETDIAVAKDLVQAICCAISSKIYQLRKSLEKVRNSIADIENELAIDKAQIVQNKGIMTDRLNEYKKRLLNDIYNIGSSEDMIRFLQTEIGFSGETIDFNVVNRQVNQIISECSDANYTCVSSRLTDYKRKFESQNEIVNGVIKSGVAGMQKVNGKMVLKTRDIFFKGHKFKPWGATKLATKIGNVAVAIGVFFDARDLYKKYKNAKDLKRIKQDLIDSLSDMFKRIFRDADGAKYYEQFAPSYIEIEQALDIRKCEFYSLNTSVSELETYKTRLEEWYGGKIEDAIFEEL